MKSIIGLIVPKCKCGKRVEPYHRQQLTWTGINNTFYRRCGACLDQDAKTGNAMVTSNTTGIYDCVMDGGQKLP